MKKIYLQPAFYWSLGMVAALYVFSFFFPVLMWVARGALLLFLGFVVLDIYLLFHLKNGVESLRITPERFSNGDENPIKINLKNHYPFKIKTEIIDEVPFQFQYRNFSIWKDLGPKETSLSEYPLTPKERGTYLFGKLNIYVKSPLGLISKRYISSEENSLPCYPSFIHLHQYELLALQNEFLLGGIKKIRKIGHTMEFEQIKNYVVGDDIRTINWKATGKHHRLMVNQYQEERAQRVYMIIDKGRTMKMPFDEMSLLDYSINATMALAHIILKKQDRAGMMTFSKKTENKVVADSKLGQMKRIAESLYNIQTNFYESDFNRLYTDIRNSINQRSLLLLFTNFETLDALKRQLKYLRAIAKNHLLVVIFFKNSEAAKMLEKTATKSTQEVYDQIIAEKFEYEKKLIRQELQKYGIFSVYTLPENLNISVINKYLEIKARGLL